MAMPTHSVSAAADAALRSENAPRERRADSHAFRNIVKRHGEDHQSGGIAASHVFLTAKSILKTGRNRSSADKIKTPNNSPPTAGRKKTRRDDGNPPARAKANSRCRQRSLRRRQSRLESALDCPKGCALRKTRRPRRAPSPKAEERYRTNRSANKAPPYSPLYGRHSDSVPCGWNAAGAETVCF